MSEQITYNFTSGSNFTYDADLVEFTGSLARLKIIETEYTYTEDFADDTDFTYNNTKAEFTGGLIQQKDQRPANATFFAAYTTTIDASWSSGTGTGTATGGAAVSGGKLVLGSGKYVSYPAAGNVNGLIQTGCLRMSLTPNYTGSPSGTQSFGSFNAGNNSAVNFVNIYHQTNGTLLVQIYGSNGVAIISTTFGSFSPTAGQTYELELNFDVTSGATRLFINGVQNGTTDTSTGTRSNNITNFNVGFNSFSSSASYFDGSIDNFLVFTTVQHTANYTPGSAPAEYIYITDTITLPVHTHASGLEILEYNSFSTTELGSPRWILNGKYHNGSAWVDSDGSYSQANSTASANAAIASHPAGGGTITIKLVFPNSNTISSANELSLVHTDESYSTANPSITANSSFTSNDLLTMDVSSSASGSDAVQMVILVNNQAKYWNGSAWVNSNNSYAQSNPVATAIANIGTLLSGTGGGSTIKPKIFLHSADATTTPTITSITITYDFQAIIPDAAATCVVFHVLRDAGNSPISGATVRATPVTLPILITDMMIYSSVTVTTDSNGQWDMDLIRSGTLGSVKYDFTFTLSNGSETTLRRTVPNSDSASFDTLAA